jgi:transposase
MITLPPYAPELNPMENVWEYLRANKLCALVWNDYDAIVEACKNAWHFLINDPNASSPSVIAAGRVSLSS